MDKMRLDKYLADYTDLSRKAAKSAIRKGRVSVGGEPVLKEDYKVLAKQKVCLDGKEILAEQFVYYMLNKPAGVITATKDKREPTVLDFFEGSPRDLFPVGRLDKDTEGLLLLTNDGALAHQLLSPKYHVEKTYYVEYEGTLAEDAEDILAKGIDIGEKRNTKPARLERQGEGKALLTISEGKFHQVKRMFARVGGCVTYLKRVAMGGVALDATLAAGEYRRLSETEMERLRQAAEGTSK